MAFAAAKGYCYGVRALYKIKVGLVRPEIYLFFSGIEIIWFLKLFYLVKSRDHDVGFPPCVLRKTLIRILCITTDTNSRNSCKADIFCLKISVCIIIFK